jgi:hypothetical protein
MVGFLEENYQILKILRSKNSAYIIVGQHLQTRQISSRARNFKLFLRSSEQTADDEAIIRLSYQSATPTTRYQLTRKNESCFCVPIRRKQQFLFEPNRVIHLQDGLETFEIAKLIPMLIAHETVVVTHPEQPTQWSAFNFQTNARQKFDFREQIPLYSPDAEKFDEVVSVDEIREKRRKLYDIDSVLQMALPFFPFSVVTSYPWNPTLQTSQSMVVNNVEQLRRVIEFSVQSNFDILWNITKQLIAPEFKTISRIDQTATRGVFIDIDDTTQPSTTLLHRVRELAQIAGWSVCSVENSASGGLHLFLQPQRRSEIFKPEFTQKAQTFIVNLSIKLQLVGITIDAVSYRPNHLYFLPGIPILKKGYRISSGMQILDRIV